MSNTTSDEKIIDRVAKLLAIAEHPNTPAPEAEVALLQANKLMAKHAIDEAIARQSQTVGQRRALASAKITIGGGSFRGYLTTVITYCADANRLTTALIGGQAHVFGAAEDVAWVEMLYSMIHLQFLSKIDPKWDPAKSYEENVYAFKVAGFKWLDINAEAMKHGGPDTRIWEQTRGSVYRDDSEGEFLPWEATRSWGHRVYEFRNVEVQQTYGSGELSAYATWEEPTNKMTARLKAAYKRWAAFIGDDSPVTTQSHSAYRRSYAEAFANTMAIRFLDMKAANEAEMDTIPGAALALRDVTEEARQMMWDEYPSLSPEEIARRKRERYEQQQREDAAYQAKLDAMTPKAREEFLAKEARKEQRQTAAYLRERDRQPRADQGARKRGASVANSIDLTRKAGRAESGAARGELG